jgi:hypothetical protein
MSFNESTSEFFFIALLDSHEYSGIPSLSFAYASQYCSKSGGHLALLNASIFVHEGEAALMFSVSASDIYRPLIVSCKSDGVSHYTVEIEFKNRNTYLDSRRIPSLIVMPLELITLAVILVFWVINQVIYRKSNGALQNFIAVTISLAVLTVGLNLVVLWADSLQDRTTILNLFQSLVTMIYEITLYSILILAAKGWCVVCEHLSASDVSEIVLYCSALFVFKALGTKIDHIAFVIVMFALTASVLLLLWMSLIKGIRAVDKQILTHMTLIYKAGIDPYSTPIYFRHLIYTFLVHVYVVYFSGLIVIMSLDLGGGLNAWLKDMLFWILNMGLMCSLGFLFRSRKVDGFSYTRFEGEEALSMENLEPFDPRLMCDPAKPSLLQWQEGMALPPPPVVQVERENRDAAILSEEPVERGRSGSVDDAMTEDLLCHV